jgi:hypothetical protein
MSAGLAYVGRRGHTGIRLLVASLSAREANRVEGMTEPEIAGTALPTVGQTQVTDVTT